jgi:hypothetical protein
MSFLFSLIIITTSYNAHGIDIGPPGKSLNASPQNAYWIWSGINYPGKIPKKSLLYIHQGTLLNKKGSFYFQRQGLGLSVLKDHPIYLTIRIQHLYFNQAFITNLIVLLQRWQRRGNQVLGLQLDFDSPTNKLEKYADFLSWVRQILPKQYRLSITGLADWASQKNTEVIKKISQNADEIIFQLYNGQSAIPHLDLYLNRLINTKSNFKLGLLEKMNTDHNTYKKIFANQNFQGIVKFIIKE